MLKSLILLFSLISVSISYAGDYICPNERNPGMALPIFAKSNHGVYVSVGSERSFIGAALTKAEALYVVDIDPDIITFTQINRALLLASIDLADYVHLRLLATADDWKTAAAYLTGGNAETLKDPKSWNFWVKFIRTSSPGTQQDCGAFHKKPVLETDPFYGANYLFDQGLYDHLRGLAQAGRIEAFVMDLTDAKAVQAVVDRLKSLGYKLGVLDTSNVITYVECPAVLTYIGEFDQAAAADSIYLLTRISAEVDQGNWHFFGFTSDYVHRHSSEAFLKTLQNYQQILPVKGTPRIILDDVDYRKFRQAASYSGTVQVLDQ